MATFEEHIKQAQKNLSVFSRLTEHLPKDIDWQITAAFYVAVHLINAHLAKSGNHFRRHEAVNDAINPKVHGNQLAISIPAYLAYNKLQSLSRKSRYLCGSTSDDATVAHICTDFDRNMSMEYLDSVAGYISDQYNLQFQAYPVSFPLSIERVLFYFENSPRP